MKRGDSLPASINGAPFAAAPPAPILPVRRKRSRVDPRNAAKAKIIHATPWRVRIRVTALASANPVEIRAALLNLNGVRDCAVNPVTRSVTVLFRQPAAAAAILKRLRAALNGTSVGAQNSHPADTAWHALTSDEVAACLHGAPRRGLSSGAVQQRLQKYGPNIIPKPEQRSDFGILAAQFNSLPVALLSAAGLVSLLTRAFFEAGAILAVIAANGAIGFITERQAERSIANLNIGGPRNCRVLRQGESQDADVESLVPGDILELQGGVAIPADARLLSAQALTVGEAALTGESVPVHKSASAMVARGASLADRHNMVYRGTIVTGGAATAMVVATGANTELGAIQRLVSSTAAPQTPIQRELAQLGGQLGWLTLAAIGVMGGIGLLRRAGILDTARSSLALAVAAVPEGLPMVATTTLAFGAEALRRRGVLVRQMNAIEALASGQVICFDKTGTLTLNRMSLSHIATGDKGWRLLADRLTGDDPARALADARLKALLRAGCLCSDAVMQVHNGQAQFTGSGTETALVRAAHSLEMDCSELRARWPRLSTVNRSEENRFMATVHGAGPDLLLAVKGSPPDVVALCSEEMLEDGSTRLLTAKALRRIHELNMRMASEGLRVLGVAQKQARKNGHAAGVSRMTWLGCFGLCDELRPGVAGLMQRLHAAGVRTVLLTGDQQATAIAVARQTGMNGGRDIRSLDGAELARMSEREIATAVPGVDAFSRVSPTQKLHVIRGLQRSGASVIMIGDGVNDGPALRAADVSLGIGHESTNAALDIAQAFIATDELEGLINAIEQGRTTYANIRKALRYLLSTNLSEVLLMLGGAVAGTGAALTPMQLLWINLITDVLPGIALALEPPEPGVMQKAPSQNRGTILGTRDLKELAREGALLASGPLAAGLYGAARYGTGSPQSRTRAFGSLVTAQLLHAISCRSNQQGIFGPGRRAENLWLTRTLIASAAAQGAALLVPALRRLMGIAALDPAGLMIGAAAGVVPFLIRELDKTRTAPIRQPTRAPIANPAHAPRRKSDSLRPIPARASTLSRTGPQQPTEQR